MLRAHSMVCLRFLLTLFFQRYSKTGYSPQENIADFIKPGKSQWTALPDSWMSLFKSNLMSCIELYQSWDFLRFEWNTCSISNSLFFEIGTRKVAAKTFVISSQSFNVLRSHRPRFNGFYKTKILHVGCSQLFHHIVLQLRILLNILFEYF